MKIVSDKDPVRQLEKLKQAMQNTIVRKAVRTAGRPVQQAIKASAPKRTGLLKRGITSKMVTKKNRVMMLIGIKKNYSGTVKGKPIRPARYLHLAERKTHFMKRSVQRTSKQYFDTVAKIINEEIINTVK